jgi:gliding motility-associated-like protein
MHVTATAISPVDTCQGIPMQLFSSGGPYYSWWPASSLNDPHTSEPFAMPDSTTTYTVYVSNDCFTDSAKVEFIVQALPYVNAGPDTTIWRNTPAYLHGTTSQNNYFWNPSTWLENATSLNTTASPLQTTWYQLFAIDPLGCMNVDSVLITVISHTELDIPSGFSPNGDGMNDVFHIVRYLNISHLDEFSVYNRWGEQVFTTDNINTGWDGTYHGKPCALGVYVWTVVAETYDGQQFIQKGNVTLLR